MTTAAMPTVTETEIVFPWSPDRDPEYLRAVMARTDRREVVLKA